MSLSSENRCPEVVWVNYGVRNDSMAILFGL
jgi:hypothetical protein